MQIRPQPLQTPPCICKSLNIIMMIIIIIITIIIIIVIIIAFKGTIQDFSQSPHCAAN